MDNVTHAIFIAFAMFSLVLGLSFGIYLLDNMNSVATTLIRSTDKTSGYTKVSYNSRVDTNLNNNVRTRQVGVDTVISTLYKYNQESFTVEIYNRSNQLMQIFDLKVEGIINSGNANSNDESSNLYKAYKDLYGEGKTANLFEAPWQGNNANIKKRIDLFVSGQVGYIESKKVDYTSVGGSNLFANGNVFKEEFIQYTFDGDAISASDSEDEEIDSIVGSRKAQNKILIKYTLQ